MSWLVKYVYFLALAAWVGGMIFFSAVVAPTLHRVLDKEHATQLTRQLFPKYYAFGIGCAGVGVLCLLVLLWERAMSFWPGLFSLLLFGGAGGTLWWLRETLLPTMNQMDKGTEWQQLHRLSVRLNVALLVAGLALIFLLVFARAA
jgi:hypothetical protein